jgi:hypothetical protein
MRKDIGYFREFFGQLLCDDSLCTPEKSPGLWQRIDFLKFSYLTENVIPGHFRDFFSDLIIIRNYFS